jgi:hypothetical protein
LSIKELSITLFGYSDSYALSNILIAFRKVLYCHRQEDVADKLLQVLSPNMSLPKLFQKIDKAIKELGDETYIQKLVKSPNQLQKSPLTWLYFALFFALNLSKDSAVNFEKNEKIEAVLLLVLKFHYYYVVYRTKQHTIGDRSFSFYVSATITIVRIIEYLIVFANANHPHIDNLYFSDLFSLDATFLKHTTEPSSLEKSYFFIKFDKKIGNYLVYQNIVEDIYLKINSSRMIRKGEQVEDSQLNQNITSYLGKSSSSYLQLMDLEINYSEQEGGRGNWSERYEIQDTEEEEFLKFVKKQPIFISSEYAHEEILEAKSLQKNDLRAFPQNDQKNEIPNLYKQHLRNRAFSANFTKRSLLLATSYDIPPLPIFKDFLLFMSLKPFSSFLKIHDLHRALFAIDAILGIGYVKIIGLLLEDKKQDITIENNYLTHKVDRDIFAKKEKNPYLQDTKNQLIYRVPRGLLLLINRAKSYFIDFSEEDKKKHYTNEAAQLYFSFMKQQMKLFPKQIHFNGNQIWKIINVYRRTHFHEDMSTMFCIGKHLQNDTPSLAYASTNKRAQNHSLLLDKLYETLDMHICIAKLLNVPHSFLATEIEFSDSHHYVGSSRAVLPEKSRSFFNRLKQLSFTARDHEKYFNLVAIYTRHSLSLLLGTRDFRHSCPLNRVSFSMHTIVISEKAQTLSSGIRLIPICEKAEEIIQFYQAMCREYGIDHQEIYLLQNQEHQLFRKDLACSLLEKYGIEEEIINFIKSVPLNTGRHCITKLAMETNFNIHYLKTFMGHYISGGEQMGIYATIDMQDYIKQTRELTSNIAKVYGV